MFYATIDDTGDGTGHISESATIRAFETEQEACEYLLSQWDAATWNHDTAQIGPGSFGDCWIKHNYDEPTPAHVDIEPFAPGQISWRAKGAHPGAERFWLEPRESVLVVTHIDLIEDEDEDA